MGRRQRQRSRLADADAEPTAATTEYADADGNVLELRGAMTAATRREYAETLAGATNAYGVGPGREDAWQRGVEFLFERLATRWVIAGVPLERQRELLQRFRAASTEERAWIRDVVRAHCAANFPDVQAP